MQIGFGLRWAGVGVGGDRTPIHLSWENDTREAIIKDISRHV